MQKLLLFLVTSVLLLNANEAKDIIQKVDANMRGKNIYMQMKMRIVAQGYKRSMQMQIWAEGSKKSFVKILYPPKDRGITFLSLNNQMWQYVPKIERIIKIPSSMMLQNWMGSDITNDDMVKQSSIVDDYNAKLLQLKNNHAFIELTPKEDAAVVWGKIVSEIDLKTYTNVEDTFYDEYGKEVRTFRYKNVKKVGGYFLPTIWIIQPSNKKKSYTKITIEDVKYDGDISQKYFEKSALKRFSR